eukprot:scaffold65012_cov66-Phaeocystis_antarctica.AAC.3
MRGCQHSSVQCHQPCQHGRPEGRLESRRLQMSHRPQNSSSLPAADCPAPDPDHHPLAPDALPARRGRSQGP